MNYIFKPSLEHIALLKVVVTLWNQDDIKDAMVNIGFPFFNRWLEIEDMVSGKAIRLPLANRFRDKILSFIKPIGFQILRWLEHHRDTFFRIDLPDQFLLTPQGTINEKETAKMLIENESIDISTRYKMSCVYCLEEDILKLWNKLPEERKKTFYSGKDPAHVHRPELVFFWTYNIKGELAGINDMIEKTMQHRCSPYQYAFECAAKHGNKAAIGYFLQKLTSSERKESLIKSVRFIAYELLDISIRIEFVYEYHSDILCILVSLMDEEQQLEVFKNFPCQILICFLDFPWQIFFKETANRMWNFLPEDTYNVLLGKMVDKLVHGYEDFNYEKLFIENWQQSPNTHKRCVLNESHEYCLLFKLFKSRVKNSIILIFQDARLKKIEEKKKFLFSYCGQDICEDLIDCNEWYLLRLFLQECVLSKDEVVKFKQDFKLHIIGRSPRDEFEKRKNKFFHMLDDFICEFNKKKYLEDYNRMI